MKRSLLIAVCLAIGAVTARAQLVPMYSEVYNEKTGELSNREWRDAKGNTRQENLSGSVTIMSVDSMMMYMLNPAKKTGTAIPIKDLNDPNKLAGMTVRTGYDVKYDIVERGVDVEGYLCDHRTSTITTTAPDGTTGGSVEHQWWHEPLKTAIRFGSGQFLHGDTKIRRNIVPGPQPASLFEIPSDYAITWTPAGGLMQMKKGNQSLQDIFDIVGGKAPAGSSPEKQQQMQDAFGNANKQ